MSTTVPEPSQQPQAAPPQPHKKRHPWHWIVPCVLLVLVSAGLAVWALGLRSDLDDEKANSAKVEQEAQATQDDVQAVSDEVDDLSQKVDNAGNELSKATDEGQANAEAAITDIQNSIQSLGDRAKAAKDKLGQAIKEAQGEGGGEPQG